MEADMALKQFNRYFGLALMLALALSSRAAPAATGADPVGRWRTADHGGVVEIQRCGATVLCGRIVGLSLDNPDDPTPTDVHGRSQCGLTIITDAVPTGRDEWTGRITNPKDGKTYGAQISIDASGRLRLRGYVGLPLFGQTVVWQPYAGRTTESCRMIG
jgi:uncharacterized protein (DUF2147 family)